MKISEDTQSILESVVELCKVLKIDQVILERAMIRGENQTDGIVLIQQLPDVIGELLEFDGIGIPRVAVLKSRMSVLGKNYSMTGETKTKDNGDVCVTRLKLKSGKTAVDYKCADPAKIRAPRNLNDPVMFTFSVDAEALDVMTRSATAMSSQNLNFSSPDGKQISVNVSDGEGDLLTHELDTPLTLHDSATKSTFTSSYKFKILLPILKYVHAQNNHLNINITKRSTINLKCNGMQIYVLPEII